MKKMIMVVLILLLATSSYALTITSGVEILAIDGNNDTNTTVNIGNIDTWDGYFLKYSVNGSDWVDVAGPYSSLYEVYGYTEFEGGDIIDFALVSNDGKNTWYILSEDAINDSFSVTMDFTVVVNAAESYAPVVTEDYYKSLVITWELENLTTYSASLTSYNPNIDDGFAPVPEPATLVLLGSGLVGLAFLKRRKS